MKKTFKGSVADKRYFTCKPMFGVFAPVAKVTPLTTVTSVVAPISTVTNTTTVSQAKNSRVSSLQATAAKSSSTSNVVTTKKPTVTLNKQMSGSQESLNSTYSQYSTASGVRPHKIGIMSKIGVI